VDIDQDGGCQRDGCGVGPCETEVQSCVGGCSVTEIGVAETVECREVVGVRPRTTAERRVDASQ